MSGGFVKVYQTILHSSIWLESPSTRVVWLTMLTMADADGYVAASVGGLAHAAVVSRAECEEALRVLSEPDPDSRTPDHEGRRILRVEGGWQIVNHRKYRDMRTPQQVATAKRVERYRKRHSVTCNDVTLEAEADTEEELPTSNVVAKDLTGQSAQTTDDDGESICPLDLEQRAISLGIARDFAGHYGVTEEAVLASVREFAAYWTIGGGAGKRKRNWPRALRQRLKELGEQGRIAPPGALEHQQRKAHEDAEHKRWLRDAALAGDFGARAQGMAKRGDDDGLDRIWKRIKARNQGAGTAAPTHLASALRHAAPHGGGNQ